MGYFRGLRRRHPVAHRRGRSGAAAGHRRAHRPWPRLGTSTATLIIVIGFVFAPIIARTVRAAVLAERELEYVAAARLRGERPLYILFVEILPNVMPPILVEFTVRIGYAIFAVATLSLPRLRHPAAVARLGPADLRRLSASSPAGYWWESLFPAVAIASLVIAVNLIADGIQQAVRELSRGTPVIDVRDLEVAYRVRGTWRAGAARRLVLDRAAASPTGWSASRAAASRRPRWPRCATCPSNGRISGGSITVDGQDLVGTAEGELRAAAAQHRVDGLPGSRPAP